MLRFLPSTAGAAGAFVVLKLVVPLFERAPFWLEALIYAAVFFAITIALDKAMVGYGRNR